MQTKSRVPIVTYIPILKNMPSNFERARVNPKGGLITPIARALPYFRHFREMP